MYLLIANNALTNYIYSCIKYTYTYVNAKFKERKITKPSQLKGISLTEKDVSHLIGPTILFYMLLQFCSKPV